MITRRVLGKQIISHLLSILFHVAWTTAFLLLYCQITHRCQVKKGVTMAESTGELALAHAVRDNDVSLITGVYGDPATALLDRLAEMGLNVEISMEEKTAMAQALGASAAGRRAAVVVKQVGLNVASDPLINAATHGIGAGLLVICGDDPGAAKSTDEQDSRWYAKLAEIPVLTPRDPASLAQATIEGLALAEELGIPVLLQITSRLTSMTGAISRTATLGKPATFDRNRPWGRFILERHRYHFEHIWPKLISCVEESKLHHMTRASGAQGVISCGFVSSLVEDENHLALGYAHPLPVGLIREFLSEMKRVLVAEEIAPIIEEGVRALAGTHHLRVEVLGRLTGHLPRVGQLEKRHIANAFSLDPQGPNFDVQVQLSDSLSHIPCGGFEMLYQVLETILTEEHQVAGDVGCSILHGYFPPQLIDTAYALGTSIATAAGMSLSGRKGIAIIGDVGFLHSGITSLLNAVEYGHNILVIVLYNRISGMTPGQQEIRGLKKLKTLIEACGPQALDEIDMQGIQPSELRGLLSRRLQERGVHVVIARGEAKQFQFGGGL